MLPFSHAKANLFPWVHLKKVAFDWSSRALLAKALSAAELFRAAVAIFGAPTIANAVSGKRDTRDRKDHLNVGSRQFSLLKNGIGLVVALFAFLRQNNTF